MARCVNCDAELQPDWKFCIACGTPVDPDRPRPFAVPSAIRPEPAVDAPPRRRIDIPLLLGIALGVGGIVLIGYLVLSFGGPS